MVDLSDPGIWERGFPHDLFAQLRAESPVFRHAVTPNLEGIVAQPFWICTKHAHTQRIHRDIDSFTAEDGPMIQRLEIFSSFPSIIVMDPPALTRRRQILSRAFTPRAVAKLEGSIRERAKRYVDALLYAGGGDWVTDLAHRLPLNVIGDIVGIPEEDREEVFGWVDSILHQSESAAAYADTFAYASELTRRKREHPADDVWSALCTTTYTDSAGESFQFEQAELEIFFFILTLAGSDTTRNALTGGLLAFVENSEQIDRYRRDPEVRATAVEEVLRWTTPIAYWVRGARHDLELDGARITKGDRVVAMLASANRDESVFDNPFRFDIARDPNPHVSFGGGGAHHCLGAMLARAEIRAAFDELLLRTRSISVGEADVSHPHLLNNMHISHHLPIIVGG